MHQLLADSACFGTGCTGTVSIPLSTVNNFKDFGAVISVILNNAVAAAGVVAFVFIIIGGFGIITSAGDSKKLEQGKNTFTWAIVGLLIVAFSLWFIQAMNIFLGFNILSPPLK